MCRTIGYITCAILALLILYTLCIGPGVAGASDEVASPSPSASVSVSPSPTPTASPSPPTASHKVYAWAMGWRGQLRSAYRPWSRARHCLGLPQRPIRLGVTPAREESSAVWLEAGYRWRHMTRSVYRPGTRRMVYRMTHPGGSGAARWWPLAHWVGWPDSERGNVIRCIGDESGGSTTADNGVCRGLGQVHVCHAATFRRVTGRSYFWGVYDALANLLFCHWLWERQGWSPWVAMRGYR